MKLALGIVVVLVIAPGVAAQEGGVARLSGRVPPAVVTSVQSLVDSAHARGLPVGPLVDKALEGGVKGVPADRIVTAVHAVFEQLDVAATSLRSVGVTGDDAIEAGAFAVAEGLSASDVAEIARTSSRTYPAATALQVAATLVALGVPRAQSVGLVRATIRSGRPLSELVSLPSQLQASMAGGVPPEVAAAGLERAAQHPAPQPKGKALGQGNPHKP